MKRKIMCVLVSAILAVSLASCGGAGNNDSPADNTSGTDSAKTEAPASPTESSASETDTSGESESNTNADDSTPVTITYANWNLGTEEEDNLERKMIRKFNEDNPNITVEPAQNVDYGDYANSLNTLAASGELPDIIMLQNIPQPYASKWLADITSVAQADGEWADIAESLVESATVNGKVVAVPFAVHMFGALINVGAFEAANLDAPKYGISLEDFESALRDVNQPQNGIVAIKHEGDMINWLPSVINKSLNYFTFDGDKFNLADDSVMTSFRKISEYRSSGLTFNSLSEDQKANFVGTNDWEAWVNGETAVNFDGTWSINQAVTEFNMDIEFMGLPNNRSVIVPDYFGVTPTCQSPAQAFTFMKWMSYGKDGFLQRMEYAKDEGRAYFSMPISTNPELIEQFTQYMTISGIKEVYDDLGGSMVEPVKVVPGYVQARWEAQTGLSIPADDGSTIENANMYQIIQAATMQGLNFADYATRVNDLANEKYNEALQSMQ